METRTQNLIFGTGRTSADLGGTFAPAGTVVEREKGSILSTFRGIGPKGWGKEAGLNALERTGLISSEQRAAQGPVGAAADGAVQTTRQLGFGNTGAATAATGAAGVAAPQYANPVYGGLYAQQLMQRGFVPPTAAPEALVAGGGIAEDIRPLAASAAPAAAADDAVGTVASTADEVVDGVVALEQQMIASFKRLAALPGDQKVSALARAVDTTAAAGHGGDAFDVLAEALTRRPLGDAAGALDSAIDDALRAATKVAPAVDDVAKVATPLADDVIKSVAPVTSAVAAAVAPAADDVAKAAAPIIDDVVRAAVPLVVEAALPKVLDAAMPALSGAATRAFVGGADDVLRGVMPFSAGIDDTLRLLAKF
jgi:hypothetical protein